MNYLNAKAVSECHWNEFEDKYSFKCDFLPDFVLAENKLNLLQIFLKDIWPIRTTLRLNPSLRPEVEITRLRLSDKTRVCLPSKAYLFSKHDIQVRAESKTFAVATCSEHHGSVHSFLDACPEEHLLYSFQTDGSLGFWVGEVLLADIAFIQLVLAGITSLYYIDRQPMLPNFFFSVRFVDDVLVGAAR